ncbi:MAG TPA: peptide chain release factor N(5)-glutamine methyltransferase [Candidatus Saccharimonadia bacterium]
MTIAEAVKLGVGMLRAAGIESARIDTYLLLSKVLAKDRAWLMAHPDHEINEDQAQSYMDLTNQRRQRVPLVHLTNKREFYGLNFYIDERVLTPRVETEKMVEYAIAYAPQHSRLLDVGTGSGAIAIAIAKHRPDLEIWATDISKDALTVAQQNADSHKVLLNLAVSSLLDQVSGRFATIVTNLPYLRDDADLMPEVRKEPGVALFGGSDGLELYRDFLKQLEGYLEPKAYVFTECDPWQHEDMTKEARKAGLTPSKTEDYFILGFQQQG